jgi:hypothetical protein
MSKDYQIAIVPVVTQRQESIALADIFGRVPVDEFKEVLDSSWAAQRGFRRVTPARQYVRTLANGVTLEVLISESNGIELRRTARTQIAATRSEAASIQLGHAIGASDAEYDLAVNELIVQTMLKAVPNRAREMGYVVAEEVVSQGPNQVIDVVLQVEVAA